MPVSELSPNPRRSTVEYIADELRDAIMAGRLEPGEQLGEADLARRFEVSRGPLREAMQRLVSEGLLHAITNRGVFVTELTLDDVLDVYRTRSVIERGALEVLLDAARRQETADELAAGRPDPATLPDEEATEVFTPVAVGDYDDIQISALLTHIRTRGETLADITGAAKAFLNVGHPFPITGEGLMDSAGTGGDGASPGGGSRWAGRRRARGVPPMVAGSMSSCSS